MNNIEKEAKTENQYPVYYPLYEDIEKYVQELDKRKLARNREEVENDIKTKMSNAEIFNKPKAFEKVKKERSMSYE